MPLLKPSLLALLLLPLCWMVWQGLAGQLGANPIEALTHQSGHWALRLLLLTLALRPLAQLSGWRWPMAIRRLVGLMSFLYALLHLGIYVGLDHFFDTQAILDDLRHRPYIAFGMAAFALLLLLAATSSQAAMRRLGRRWGQLHRLIYPAALLGLLHYWLVSKTGSETWLYGYTVLTLLLLALRWPLRQRNGRIQATREKG